MPVEVDDFERNDFSCWNEYALVDRAISSSADAFELAVLLRSGDVGIGNNITVHIVGLFESEGRYIHRFRDSRQVR